MIDYAKNLRLPLLAAVLVLTSVLMINGVARFVLKLVRGGGIGDAGRIGAAESPSLVWMLTTLVLVLALVLIRPQPQGTVRMVRISAVVVAISAVLALVFWVLTLWEGLTFGQLLSSVGGLIETIAKAGVAVLLFKLHGVGRRDLLAALNKESAASGETAATETDSSVAPIWAADQATGYQWTSAAQAAQGSAPNSDKPALTAVQQNRETGLAASPETRPAPDWGQAVRKPISGAE